MVDNWVKEAAVTSRRQNKYRMHDGKPYRAQALYNICLHGKSVVSLT